MNSSISSWPRHRSSFNHDWLKNAYLPALHKWLNILAGQVEDHEFERTFREKKLVEWEGRSQECRKLIQDFGHDMSPARCFERHPLSNCSARTRAWLLPLVHALWEHRCLVAERTGAATEALHAAQTAYELLRSSLASGTAAASGPSAGALRPLSAEFVSRCAKLSQVMSRFPVKARVA